MEILHEYWKAKSNITKNQTENDYLNHQWGSDPSVQERSAYTKAQVIRFSTEKEIEGGAYIKDSAIYFKDESVIVSYASIVLPGAHNLENILMCRGCV